MNCPHCGKKLEFLSPTFSNCEIYGGFPKGVTSCCGNIVAIERVISFRAHIPYNHSELKEDDWGNKKTDKGKVYQEPCHSDERSVFSAMQGGTDGG